MPAATPLRARASLARLLLVVLLALGNLGWSGTTTRHVAWTAVEFFPPDLARQVKRHHRRFDAGIRRGLAAPPAWRAGPPGKVADALISQLIHCHRSLLKPVPLEDLVEELGVLAVHVLDANDPLAVEHVDSREPLYSGHYQRYVDSVRGRVRLVYYGQSPDLIYEGQLQKAIAATLGRSRELYPYVGDEFYRTGQLRDWRTFDDRSVAFGVAAIAMSHGMTDLANMVCYVWHRGGGLIPAPAPTPEGQVGTTLQVALGGGFPERQHQRRGRPTLPVRSIVLPQR